MDAESTPSPSGLKTAWDTIVAPKDAMLALRAAPTWGWALLIVVVVSIATSYIVTPAAVHGLQTDWPNMGAKNPALAGLSADVQQRQLAFAMKITGLVWIFSPIFAAIAALIGAVVLLIFNALGHGDGSFGKYWAAQWNIGLVSALGAIALAVVVLARGVDGFATPQAVQEALPSFGMLVPASSVKLHAFLGAFTPFSIWASGLEVAALAIVGRVPRITAWLGGGLTLLIPALFAAAFAR